MFQVLINGLVLGTVYALIALGLTMVFSIMRVVNFAHGQMYMLGGVRRVLPLRPVLGPALCLAPAGRRARRWR